MERRFSPLAAYPDDRGQEWLLRRLWPSRGPEQSHHRWFRLRWPAVDLSSARPWRFIRVESRPTVCGVQPEPRPDCQCGRGTAVLGATYARTAEARRGYSNLRA